MNKLRERSGCIISDDPLVSFLYELMRDYLTPGTIEEMMLDIDKVPVAFSNGWLASYAIDLANRLRKNK